MHGTSSRESGSLSRDQAVAFVEYGRLLSLGDEAMVSQLALVASSRESWLETHSTNCSCYFCDSGSWYDRDDEMSLWVGAYMYAMSLVLKPFVIQFWRNMGDAASWMADAALRRRILLNGEKLTADCAIETPEGGWRAKWEISEAMFIRARSAVEDQGFELHQLYEDVEGAHYACVVSQTESSALEGLASWAEW